MCAVFLYTNGMQLTVDNHGGFSRDTVTRDYSDAVKQLVPSLAVHAADCDVAM
jgi:hypothetical protein